MKILLGLAAVVLLAGSIAGQTRDINDLIGRGGRPVDYGEDQNVINGRAKLLKLEAQRRQLEIQQRQLELDRQRAEAARVASAPAPPPTQTATVREPLTLDQRLDRIEMVLSYLIDKEKKRTDRELEAK